MFVYSELAACRVGRAHFGTSCGARRFALVLHVDLRGRAIIASALKCFLVFACGARRVHVGTAWQLMASASEHFVRGTASASRYCVAGHGELILLSS